MARKIEDLTGRQFGRLTVVQQHGWYDAPNKSTRMSTWLCRCACGKEKVVRRFSLISGETKSCNCLAREATSARNRIEPSDSAWNTYFQHYRASATRRGLSFNLSVLDIMRVASQPCYYCGIEPTRYTRSKNKYTSQAIKDGSIIDESYAESKVIYANGLDRVDNQLGYESSNIVSCCEHCNIAKSDYTEQEWNNWLNRLIAHQTKSKD